MSEPQFAYNNFTLDELRSLAASPQVGTMQAMPQSFRALADRVGEVADLLSHAQADLPNWWKGPAAQQAAASLGRAVAEAREFHDSAIGAATAVSRCAQVVAEQQNQMMNVPDVHEPGVSAVVQRPTTPFEALEAARQDATYQAAHEQAVQVVNGIAAQYVETRSQLSNIGALRTENFIPTSTSPKTSETNAMAPREGGSHFVRHEAIEESQFSQPSLMAGTISSGTQESVRAKSLTPLPKRMGRYAPEEAPTRSDDVLPTEGLSHKATEHITPEDPIFEPPLNDSPGLLRQGRVGDSENSVRGTSGASYPSSETGLPTSLHFEQEETPVLSTIETSKRIVSDQSRFYGDHRSIQGSEKRKSRYKSNEVSSSAFLKANQGITPDGHEPFPPPTEPGYQPQINQVGNEEAVVPPPCSALGPAYRNREERGRRPDYLKERKSEWLPETVAAPPDGIITPDWPERH